MLRSTFRSVAALCAATTLVLPSTAAASVGPKGSSFSAIAAGTRGSAVAYDTINHVYLIVSTYGMVRGRIYNEDGAALTDAFQIQSSSNFTHFPRVAFSPDANGGNGGFLVTWHESDVSTGTTVHARIVTASGGLASGDTRLAGGDVSFWEVGPAVTYSTGSHEFLVVWPNVARNAIHGVLVNASGAQVSGLLSVTSGSNYADNPSVGYNPDTNEFLVAWSGYNNTGAYAYVSSQRVNSSGANLGSPVVLTTAGGTFITDTQYSPASGNYIVAWYQSGGAYTRQVNSSGSAAGGVTPVATRFSSYDALSFAFNPVSNTFLMVSHDTATVEDGATEVSGTGSPLDSGQDITNAAGTGNFYPRIAANARRKEWLLSTAHSFTSTVAQYATSDSTGGSSGPAALKATSISLSPGGPYAPGGSVTLTANTTGGTAPLTYQFWVNDGSGYRVAQDYSASNQVTLSNLVAGSYAAQVWVRNAGSSANYDAWVGTSFTVGAAKATITAFSVDRSFPVALNVPISWSSSATAAGGSVEYKWWKYSDGAWSVAQDWSSLNALTWFPTVGTHAVQVWARRVGSTANYEDYRSSGYFDVVASSTLKIATFSANKTFPASPSSTITWTATTSGGSGSVEYKFWLYRAASQSWSILQDWSSSNQVSWTPGVVSTGNDALQVWVRNTGSTANYEAWASTGYFLISDSTSLTVTPNQSLASLHQGASVTFTGNMATGGPYEYIFWTFDASSGTWTAAQGYSTTNTFTWAGISAGTHAVQVWARAVGSTVAYERWISTGLFVVNP